ncbi:MAG: SRPBCC family protein [Myxococcaceae bacterium]
MLRKILIGVVAVLLVLVIIIATRPSTYRIERSTRIAAPPDVVFGLVNDFHAWDGWSPWAKLDPTMKTTYGGPASGVGATYAWVGDSKVGEGKMTITESRPSQKVGIRLEFIKPMPGITQTDFGFQPEGGGTQVNWVMTGTNDFLGKAFSLVADMDAMIGKDFDKGLAAMRTEAEADAKRRAAAASAVAPATATVPAAPAGPPATAR